MKLRRAHDRGHADYGWLDSWHSFSFGNYYDPRYVQFRALRVINDDTVEPGAGFPMHEHHDMEIVSYVLEGALAHEDSMGASSIIEPGGVQCISAGTGVRHSEFNASPTDKVHFLQIWFLPSVIGKRPSYEKRHFAEAEKRGRLCVVASPDGAGHSAIVHAHARMLSALLNSGERLKQPIPHGCFVYVHIARGTVSLNGTILAAGDAATIMDESHLVLEQGEEAEVLVFELR